MMKTLQLYTVCIVIVVIVLSQFSLLNDSEVEDYKTVQAEENTNKNTTDENGLLNSLKNSKYAEPIKEVQGIVEDVNKSKNELKNSINSLKDLLDIEKNLDGLTEALK